MSRCLGRGISCTEPIESKNASTMAQTGIATISVTSFRVYVDSIAMRTILSYDGRRLFPPNVVVHHSF